MPSSTRSLQRRASRAARRGAPGRRRTRRSGSARGRRGAQLDLPDRLPPMPRGRTRGWAGRHHERAPARRTPRRLRRRASLGVEVETWCHAWPGSGSSRGPSTASPTTWTFSDGNRRELAPEIVERVAVEAARARVERDGSIRCGAPISETCTCSAGCSRTSTPAAPAWSRWMCDRSSGGRRRARGPARRGRLSSGNAVVGPQSKRPGRRRCRAGSTRRCPAPGGGGRSGWTAPTSPRALLRGRR
jgi:hypothetical protein